MQVLVNGIAQGLLFALIGVAFSLVYSTTRTFHVALGGIYTLAPYLLLSFLHSGIPLMVGVLLAISGCSVMGLICEETLHWPLLRKSAPSEVHLVASLGMFLIIVQFIALIWGNDTQVLRVGLDAVFKFSGLRLVRAQAIGGIGALFLITLFFFWLRQSSIGLQFRAMSDNPVLLGLMGRNVRLVRRLVFMLSAAIAAMVAMASAYDVGFDPNIGMQTVLVGMIATVVGGRGSFVGAVVAGLLLGIIRSQIVWYTSARWEEAATFMILAAVLFFRPQGLFGRAFRLEEKI